MSTEIAGILKEVVRHGDFTLASGKKSSYYVDVKHVVTNPVVMKYILAQMSPYVWGHDRVAGIEMGSIPLAVGAAVKFHKSYVLIRKSNAPIGVVRLNEKVLPIEDVTTTGATLMNAVHHLRKMGAVVRYALTIVDREEGAEELLKEAGVELYSLTTAKELME